MSLLDLLFVLVFFVSLVAGLALTVFAIRRQYARALRLLRTYGIGLALYFGIVILVSVFLPRHVLRVGEAQCFDDWCIAVDKVDRASAGAKIRYKIALALSSRARRVSQRENNIVVYLSDRDGRRYDPIPEQSAVASTVLLQPAESVTATRVFEVPVAARDIGLVMTHEGGFPIGWLIIGYETWFRKPTIVPLPS